jgi:hypothetical protein
MPTGWVSSGWKPSRRAGVLEDGVVQGEVIRPVGAAVPPRDRRQGRQPPLAAPALTTRPLS